MRLKLRLKLRLKSRLRPECVSAAAEAGGCRLRLLRSEAVG